MLLTIPTLFSGEEYFAFPSLSWGRTLFPLHIAGSKPGGKRKSMPGPEGAVVNSEFNYLQLITGKLSTIFLQRQPDGFPLWSFNDVLGNL